MSVSIPDRTTFHLLLGLCEHCPGNGSGGAWRAALAKMLGLGLTCDPPVRTNPRIELLRSELVISFTWEAPRCNIRAIGLTP